MDGNAELEAMQAELPKHVMRHFEVCDHPSPKGSIYSKAFNWLAKPLGRVINNNYFP
jgi:hypothetical protein